MESSPTEIDDVKSSVFRLSPSPIAFFTHSPKATKNTAEITWFCFAGFLRDEEENDRLNSINYLSDSSGAKNKSTHTYT